MSDEVVKYGHWCAYVAGQPPGWDMTALGIAIYDSEGKLAYSKFVNISKAIRRGDWQNTEFTTITSVPHNGVPENWEEMEKTLGLFGNAMSSLRWEGDAATALWDQKSGDSLFKTIVGDESQVQVCPTNHEWFSPIIGDFYTREEVQALRDKSQGTTGRWATDFCPDCGESLKETQ